MDYESQFNSSGNSSQLTFLHQNQLGSSVQQESVTSSSIEDSLTQQKSSSTTILIRDEDTDQIQKLTFSDLAVSNLNNKSSSNQVARSSLLSLTPNSQDILNAFNSSPDALRLPIFNNTRTPKY